MWRDLKKAVVNDDLNGRQSRDDQGTFGAATKSCHSDQKKADCKKQSAFFSYIRPPHCGVASSMHFVRDIAFGSDMRFARWKLQGEYNITAKQSGAISLLRSKNITLSVRSISLNSLQLVAFCF